MLLTFDLTGAVLGYWVQCGQLVHTLKSATRGAEKTAEVQTEGGRRDDFRRLGAVRGLVAKGIPL